MRWDQLFMHNGRVRPSWRFLLAVVMIVFAYLVVGIVLGLASELFAGHLTHVLLWSNLFTLSALLAIFKFLTSFFEERPLGSMGLAFCGRWKTELCIGIALGAAMILTVALLEWVLGAARFGLNSISPKDALASSAYYLLLFAVAAANEEIIFRGYAFQRLIDAIQPAAAVAVASISFGLLHLANPFHTWISTLNTVLFGVVLALGYLRTRALSLPMGMHAAWNAFQGYVLGLQVSGLQLSKTLFKADVRGPQWLTGGSYGPEASWLTTGVVLAATLYLSLSRSIYITEEMRKLALDAPKSPPELPHSEVGARMTSLVDSAKIDLSGEI